jgi:hypothetical protein
MEKYLKRLDELFADLNREKQNPGQAIPITSSPEVSQDTLEPQINPDIEALAKLLEFVSPDPDKQK